MPRTYKARTCTAHLAVCRCTCVCDIYRSLNSRNLQIQVRINHYRDSCSPAVQHHTALYVEAELAGHGLSLGQSQRTAFAQLQGDSFRWFSILTFPQKVRMEGRKLVSMLSHVSVDSLQVFTGLLTLRPAAGTFTSGTAPLHGGKARIVCSGGTCLPMPSWL